LPVAPLDQTAHFPNTSPFGSTTGSVKPIITSGLGGNTSITNNGAASGSLALLDLGGDTSLTVSKAVADSLVAAWNGVGAGSVSNADNGANTLNGQGNDSANPANNVLYGNVINGIPDLQAGLITFPGSPVTSLAQGLAGDLAAVTNPEPSTLILFGTGLLLVTRRFGRKRH